MYDFLDRSKIRTERFFRLDSKVVISDQRWYTNILMVNLSSESLEIHQGFMRMALSAARKAEEAGEVPVGAVLVGADHNVLGLGFNQAIALNDPTAHAEIVALRQAAAACGNYRLTGAWLYVTVEPCIMCAGAVLQARIEMLIFGAYDPKGGAFGSLYNMAEDKRLNHRIKVIPGILPNECQSILQSFFKGKRTRRGTEEAVTGSTRNRLRG